MTPEFQRSFPSNIGRNDSCPCGSGKKYKKCCMKSHAEEKAAKSSAFWREEDAGSSAPDYAGMGLHPYAICKFVTHELASPSSHLSKADIARLKDKWNIAKVAAIETGELVSRLAKLGIDAREDAYRALAAGRDSAWSIGNDWYEAADAPTGKGDEDFICLAACELWKRYCPERPSIEMVDDWVSEGSELAEAGSDLEAVDVWLRVWEYLIPRIKPEQTTFYAVDPIFKISQFFGNWIQDYGMSLGNAALRDPGHAETGILVTRFVLNQFPDENLQTLLNFRCDLGRFLCKAGRGEEGILELESIIREHPELACGYACLSDELGSQPQRQSEAVAVLERALAHPVVDAADWGLKYRLKDLRDEMKRSKRG